MLLSSISPFIEIESARYHVLCNTYCMTSCVSWDNLLIIWFSLHFEIAVSSPCFVGLPIAA